MTLKDIFSVIARNGSGLTQTDFMGEFLATYCEEFKIKNRADEPYVWDPASISRLMTKDDFPSRKCIFPAGKNDFGKRLENVVNRILGRYDELINAKTLKSDLLPTLKGLHVDAREEEAASPLLTKLLLIWFKRKYEEARKNRDGIQTWVRPSLFAMLIEEVANQAPEPGVSVKLDLSYTIEDKIAINDIKNPLKDEIIVLFDLYYESIEKALEELSQKDVNIRSKFLNKVKRYYLAYLSKNRIGHDDVDAIKRHSAKVFSHCSHRILDAVKNRDMKNVYEEDLLDYVDALTTYAFYKCRILLKVGKEDAD